MFSLHENLGTCSAKQEPLAEGNYSEPYLLMADALFYCSIPSLRFEIEYMG